MKKSSKALHSTPKGILSGQPQSSYSQSPIVMESITAPQKLGPSLTTPHETTLWTFRTMFGTNYSNGHMCSQSPDPKHSGSKVKPLVKFHSQSLKTYSRQS